MATELPEGTSTHRAEGDRRPTVRCAIVTVSDSRTADTDTSGARMRELLETTGYAVIDATLLPNDEDRVRAHVVALVGRGDVDAILLTGGTGLGQRDRTIEAVRPLFDKELPGFGEIFRLLSFREQVGTAAILSRAVAGAAGRTFIASMPGSTAAVELALTRVLIPELRHVVRELSR